MTIEEKVREIMLFENLSSSEKRDQTARPDPGPRVQDRQFEQGDDCPAQPIARWLGSDRCDATTQRRTSEKETRRKIDGINANLGALPRTR
jgi:hypothetical protein